MDAVPTENMLQTVAAIKAISTVPKGIYENDDVGAMYHVKSGKVSFF